MDCAACPAISSSQLPARIDCGEQGGQAASASHSLASINQLERRYLTIMFCDLVESTRLTTFMDPEELLQIIGAYWDICATTINNHGGSVACYMGDGVMSCFGYPQAHENDGERAAQAALELLKACKNLKIETGGKPRQQVSIRIGIASGVVVVGKVSSAGTTHHDAVLGKTPNLAARLQMLAQPGTALISDTTRHLIRGRFRLRSIGSRTIPGFEQRYQLWQLRDAVPVSTLRDIRLSPSLTLPGRNMELNHIMRQWQHATQHQGRVVLVSGEAGIGKSKLLETLHEQTSQHTVSQYLYHCAPNSGNGCYRPRANEQTLAADGALAHIIRKLEQSDTQRPCLVILEDIHWITASSLRLLDGLIPRIRDKAVLLALSHRSDFAPSPGWLQHAHVQPLSLGPLQQTDALLLISQLIDQAAIPTALISQIIAQGEGIPFFLEELTRMALALSTATPSNGAPDCANLMSDDLDLPPTLQTALMARLDQRSSVRAVAQLGAALGDEFHYGLLAKLCMHKKWQLDGALHSLCDSGLLVKTEGIHGERYAFRLVMLREAAYRSILRGVRRRLHQRIAQALERYFPEITVMQPEVLTHHYARAAHRAPMSVALPDATTAITTRAAPRKI